MKYCKECGCYIPEASNKCLACGRYIEGEVTKEYKVKPETTGKVKNINQSRIDAMQAEFQKHKREAEERTKQK